MKLLGFLLIVTTCLISFSCQEGHNDLRKTLKKFQNSYKLKKYEQNGFLSTGMGTESKGGLLNLLVINFITQEELDISKSRKIIVECILEYINEVNSKSNLEEYFVEWPFQAKHLQYTLGVDRGDGTSPEFPLGPTEDNKISYVYFLNGNINYMIFVAQDEPVVTIHQETLEEAIAILKKEGWTEPVYE